MSATTDSSWRQVDAVRSREHPDCIVCAPDNPHGLHVRFEVLADGSTQGCFACQKVFEGFPGVIHGGVLSALADEAMLHCLLARGVSGMTAELAMQFRHPVQTKVPATIRAELVEQSGSLYTLAATVIQGGQVKVRAKARFVDKLAGRNVLVPKHEDGNGHNRH